MNGEQMRFTPGELETIKNTFKDNEALLRLLRKVFLPWVDPEAPIGQVIDLWMTVDVRNLDPQTALVRLIARNELITHVEQQLMQLKVLSSRGEVAEEQLTETRKKDSAK